MEGENMSRKVNTSNKQEDGEVALPGFRFHPTDEELVGFYLRRKVEKRPIGLELIKQADIYKYDPWDLASMPAECSNGGDKEWYFFCKRGRKYKNSIRPNRVTGSGFWKATGIDRPVYSSSGEAGSDYIGLKKSLAYYRGSAGRGIKTDWMMHEFRLPPNPDKSTKNPDQEAEVWTLCRILKRKVSYRKCVPDWRQVQVPTGNGVMIDPGVDAISETCSVESWDNQSGQSNYTSFSAPVINQSDKKPYSGHVLNQQFVGHNGPSVISQAPSAASLFSNYVCADIDELLRHAEWGDLQAMVDRAVVTNPFCP